MSTVTIDALHDIHTATNDVLKGYSEMSARAKPDIKTVMLRLTAMHVRHAAEQSAELARLRDAGKADSSVQGTVNKVVVILRDWLADLDRDALPAVRDGEKSLRDKYDEALGDAEVRNDAAMFALLTRQRMEINGEIDRLPVD